MRRSGSSSVVHHILVVVCVTIERELESCFLFFVVAKLSTWFPVTPGSVGRCEGGGRCCDCCLIYSLFIEGIIIYYIYLYCVI